MSTSSPWILRVGLPVAGFVIGVSGLLLTVTGWKWPNLLVSDRSRFFCQQQMYPNEGQIWTVAHDNGSGNPVPWMRMVNEFGGDWNAAKRCETIADRLEQFRKDGLVDLEYRSDPSTPQQYVICAKTKKSGSNCPLLVTLKPKEDPYLAFSKAVAALHDRQYVDRSSTSIARTGQKQIATVNVEHLLDGK